MVRIIHKLNFKLQQHYEHHRLILDIQKLIKKNPIERKIEKLIIFVRIAILSLPI